MHGGERPKWQRLRTNCPALLALRVECDGAHPHKSWGAKFADGKFLGFHTKEEAEYPDLLCSTLARLGIQRLVE